MANNQVRQVSACIVPTYQAFSKTRNVLKTDSKRPGNTHQRGATFSTRCHNVEPQSAGPSRRDAMIALSTTLFASSPQDDAKAAYGEGARVFGSRTNTSDFIAYSGDGYRVVLPAKWNPNRSTVDGSALRYADNMRDDGANLDVVVTPTTNSSVKDLGSLEEFFPQISYLLGDQSFDGETKSEGGFASGEVVTAALLDSEEKTDAAGITYYTYHILTRTADGEGGGRHHLFKSAIANGKQYTLQVQALDKQWFKGSEKPLRTVLESFTVA